jgi:YfiH family protein
LTRAPNESAPDTTPPFPAGTGRVAEARADAPVPLYVHADWVASFPWLVQGTTGRGDADDPFDLGLFGGAPVGATLGRWRRLREATGVMAAVHSRQVHGAEIRAHEGSPLEGLLVIEGADGHVTGRPGLLLSVSVADCVPISIVDPERRRIALLHAGWRGTAAGILGRGLDRMADDGAADRLHVHLGPAVCGRCYEVGPEVHEALGLHAPRHNTPVDVRAALANRAVERGVPAAQVTVSEHCTLCGEGFFSHRAGDAGRQMGVLGVRT